MEELKPLDRSAVTDSTMLRNISSPQPMEIPNPSSTSPLPKTKRTYKKRKLKAPVEAEMSVAKKAKKSSTVESRHQNRKTTYKDRLVNCKPCTRNIELLKISGQGSTSNEKAYRGFWNSALQEKSKNVWLPTGIVCVDSDTNSYSGCSQSTEFISSFKTKLLTAFNRNSLKTSWPSSTYSPVGLTDQEDTKRPSKAYFMERMKEWKEMKYTEKKMEELREKERREMEEKEKQVKSYTRCQKIQLQVTNTQRLLFLSWMKAANTTHNLALGDLLTAHKHWIETEPIASIEKYLKNRYVTAENISEKHKYLLHTPADIRKSAVKELISHLKAYRTNRDKRLELRAKYPLAKIFQKDFPFHINFMSVRQFDSCSLSMEQKSFRFQNAHSFGLFSSMKFKLPRDVDTKNVRVYKGYIMTKETVSTDIKLHYSFGNFYLLAPYTAHVQQVPIISPPLNTFPVSENLFSPLEDEAGNTQNVENQMDVEDGDEGTRARARARGDENVQCEVAMKSRARTENWFSSGAHLERDAFGCVDPGVRKPFTIYSPQGRVDILGANSNKVLDRYLLRVDKKQKVVKKKVSEMNVNKSVCGGEERVKWRRKIRRANQAFIKARSRLKNVVKHFHYNAAHHMCRNYETILLPTYGTHGMVNKMGGKRKIRKCVVRRMQALSFYQFSERLKQVASLYPGTRVLRGSEAYTSKTCGCCGFIKENLGGSETFSCHQCQLSADRDIHAGRNIFLRSIAAVN